MTGVVVDASALAEQLIGSRRGRTVSAVLAEMAVDRLHFPHLATVEVVSVLRGWVHGSHLSAEAGRSAVLDLQDYPATRWPTEPFVERVWELRDNVTAYDAVYVALAEALGATLLTADHRLQRRIVGVSRCQVVTV